MINSLTRFIARILFILSILAFLSSLLLLGLSIFVREDGGQKLSALISTHIGSVELNYASADINFSINGFHFIARDITLNVGGDRLVSPKAEIWLPGDQLKIALEKPDIIISSGSSPIPPIPIEISARAANIKIPHLSLTLNNTDLALIAANRRWLLNATATNDGHYLHARIAGDSRRHIRLYAEIDNFPLPLTLPFSWSQINATIAADISDHIQYRARGALRDVSADSPQTIAAAAVTWRSEGNIHSSDEMHITMALNADDLRISPEMTITAAADAVWQLGLNTWTLDNARLRLSHNNSTLGAAFDGHAIQRPACTLITQCIDHIVINYYALVTASLPQAPDITLNIGSDGSWRQTDNGWQLAADHLQILTEDAAMSMTLTLHADTDTALTVLAASGKIGEIQADAIPRYLPAGDVRQWLSESLTAATFKNAAFTVHSSGDFTAARTTLKMTAEFSGGQINIADGWPPAQQLQGTIRIDNDDILIHGGGVFDGLPAPTVIARIPAAEADSPATLFLDIVSAPTALDKYAAAARRTPPLKGFIQEADAAFTLAGGRGQLSLTITVPLTQPETSRVQAGLALQHAAVEIAQLPPYTEVRGSVYFNNDGINGALDGRLDGAGLDAPRLSVVFDSTDISVYGSADVSVLLSIAGIDNAPLSGSTSFSVSRNAEITVFRADLEDTIIDLPYPLGKRATLPVTLSVKLADDTTTARYQSNHLTLNMSADADGTDIAINDAAAAPPAAGMNIHGNARDLSVDLWMQKITQGGGALPPLSIQLTLNNIDFMGVSNERFIIHGGNGGINQPISINLDSSSAVGNIVFSDSMLQGDFSYLHLSSDNNSLGSGDQITSLAITVNIATLAIGNLTLGAMTLAGAPIQDNWQLQQLAISTPHITLNIGGVYEKKHTFLTVNLNVSQLPSLLTVLQIPQVFGRGQVSVFGSIAWPGTPINFRLDKMKGNIRLLAQEVQYLDIDTGTEVVNFLAIFSPQSLFSLGFTELEKNRGIVFNTVRGDIALDLGKANLHQVNLISNDLHMDIQGSTNYIYHLHNLHGRVRPGEKLLNAGSAVGLGAQLIASAGLTAINPASLVAGSLLGKIFEKPISEIGGYDYTITGSWQEPIYKEIGLIENIDNAARQKKKTEESTKQ